MARGGKGAPLVPHLDFLWFRDERIGRIAQNIGGIANLTAIPAAASRDRVLAFDTGPGNMVIDALAQQLFSRPFDDTGKIAASGKVIEPVLQRVLAKPFFRAKPPKTAGREEFGREFISEFRRSSGRARDADIVATATALTARSIADAVKRFVLPRSGARSSFRELIVSGGGAKNATLLAMLAKQLAPMGIVIRFSDEFGLPSQAKRRCLFSPSSPMRRGTVVRRMCRPRQEQSGLQSWGRFRMREVADLGHRACAFRPLVPRCIILNLRSEGPWFFIVLCCLALLPLLSCYSKPHPNTLVMIIESSPRILIRGSGSMRSRNELTT